MAFNTDESVWLEFLRVWPISRLRTMTLPEYSSAGDRETFTTWLESKLDIYGSIWGGSAFKFGIYSRAASTEEENGRGMSYDNAYGWYSKFGATSSEAFEAVRTEVVRIAEAARDGRWTEIDESQLGNAYTWKIAFHYQSRSTTQIPSIFLRKSLLAAVGLPQTDRITPLSTLYQRAAALRDPNESVLTMSYRLWKAWAMTNAYEMKLSDAAARTGYLPVNTTAAPFADAMHGGLTENEKGKTARFRTDTGKEFESDIRITSPGRGQLRQSMQSYFAEIGAEAGTTILVTPLADGSYTIEHKDSDEGTTGPKPPPQKPAVTMPPVPKVTTRDSSKHSLNQILYGPPGTGKTYQTIEQALRILDPEFLSTNISDRSQLKSRFDTLSQEGLIEFVTFHQSFSYEDFVEGLRAETDEEDGRLRYEITDGVFKRLCLAAQKREEGSAATSIDPAGRKIWKLSLGNSYTEQYIFDECMERGIALLGFGAKADYSNSRSREDIEKTLQQNGVALVPNDYQPTAINTFVRQMNKGDLLIVTEGNVKFRAIGVITGDYRLIKRENDTYAQCRDVDWIRVYRPSLPHDQLMNSRFSQMTTYELREPSIDLTKLRALLRPTDVKSKGQNNRVLIIDEINRGNVSRIFGELISLIEPSKREGAPEALKAVLPYSKEPFSVPDTVHIIGTMNTADRSLAGLDIALRRRFEFVEMPPRPDLLKDVSVEGVNLGDLLDVMNQRIEVLLDRDHQLGHAYFMSVRNGDPLSKLETVFRNQIIPLLQEYFFEDWQRIAWVLNDHRKELLFQFLQRPSTNIFELFGNAEGVPTEPKRWRINEAAFSHAESYAGIVKV